MSKRTIISIAAGLVATGIAAGAGVVIAGFSYFIIGKIAAKLA